MAYVKAITASAICSDSKNQFRLGIYLKNDISILNSF